VKVFVVIVTYNGSKWIDQCVGHTLRETIKPDIIVIDNHSSDNTTQLIEKNYPEVQLIKSKENLGFGKANNMGLKMACDAKADYVLLLNQDAWLEADTLERLIKAQQSNPEFDLVSPMHMNGAGNALDYNFSTYINPADCKNLYSDIFTNTVRQKVYEVKFINAACWLLTKKCIETVGGFSPVFYHYAEDDNYVHRMHYHGLKLGVYPLAKMFHDREQHSAGTFHDKAQIKKRIQVIKYSNPNSTLNIDNDIKLQDSFYWRALVKFKFNKAKEIANTKKELIQLAALIKKPLETSKQKGPNFL
jgi:N-acetylglucosaminyl-diphospho-decaprenol L-rhamnosyltransferase